ncbi:MAG: undecaprenyl-diphosphate phosphatase [Pseudomonadota bacterium]
MDILHLIVLALVQGVTEFLPISSSGHLILIPLLTQWPDQGVLIDIAVHIGTLGAVIMYLSRDLTAMVGGFVGGERSGSIAAQNRGLVWKTAIATVPIIVAGFALHEFADINLRSLTVIAWAMIGFGIVLWLADRYASTNRELAELSYGDAVLIGVAQVLALIPGTSRAGITMTAARMLGYQRTDAARFSMLLSIPTIFAAGGLATIEIIAIGNFDLGRDALFAALLSMFSALIAIVLMMRWLRNASFMPFVVYRVVFGLVLLVVFYTSH